jgi:hypothetical protein
MTRSQAATGAVNTLVSKPTQNMTPQQKFQHQRDIDQARYNEQLAATSQSEASKRQYEREEAGAVSTATGKVYRQRLLTDAPIIADIYKKINEGKRLAAPKGYGGTDNLKYAPNTTEYNKRVLDLYGYGYLFNIVGDKLILKSEEFPADILEYINSKASGKNPSLPPSESPMSGTTIGSDNVYTRPQGTRSYTRAPNVQDIFNKIKQDSLKTSQ